MVIRRGDISLLDFQTHALRPYDFPTVKVTAGRLKSMRQNCAHPLEKCCPRTYYCVHASPDKNRVQQQACVVSVSPLSSRYTYIMILRRYDILLSNGSCQSDLCSVRFSVGYGPCVSEIDLEIRSGKSVAYYNLIAIDILMTPR